MHRAGWQRRTPAGTLEPMSKNYLLTALGVVAASVTAVIVVGSLRRARRVVAPVSPTVPRIEEVREALAESTETQAS